LVITYEDLVIVIVEALEGCPQHRCDHRRFVPGGNEHRHETWVFVEDVIACVSPPMAPVDGQEAPEAPGKIDDIDG
jgi:hypothetical protein